jgi:hypothetical protein
VQYDVKTCYETRSHNSRAGLQIVKQCKVLKIHCVCRHNRGLIVSACYWLTLRRSYSLSVWERLSLDTLYMQVFSPVRDSMPPVAFEPTIPASERPHTYVLEQAAPGTGASGTLLVLFSPATSLWQCVNITRRATNLSRSWYRVALSFLAARDLRNSADWWCVQGWSDETERCDIISRSWGDTLGPGTTGEKGKTEHRPLMA